LDDRMPSMNNEPDWTPKQKISTKLEMLNSSKMGEFNGSKSL